MSTHQFFANAKDTYFKLMLNGYATGVSPELVRRFEGDLNGTKRNVWGDPKGWYGIDEWRTSGLGDASNGTTSIYFQGDLVWEMQYGGWYVPDAIPFLRKALHKNYANGVWWGGRGPVCFEEGSFRYINVPDDRNAFDLFTGTEFIQQKVNGEWCKVGQHSYHGGFMMV